LFSNFNFELTLFVSLVTYMYNAYVVLISVTLTVSTLYYTHVSDTTKDVTNTH